MGRPERHDVDYFPFFVKRGKTLNILQSQYGLEGIGFFTNLLRFLSQTPDHYYCIKDEADKLNFFAEIGMVDENRGIAMIELMVKTAKFDKELWENHRVIASEAFLKSLEPAYDKRNNKVITIDEIKAIFENGGKKPISDTGNPLKVDGNPTESDSDVVSGVDNPQSKVKKSKVNKTKYTDGSKEPPFSDKTDKPKKPPLREREPENDMERVEKAYLQNWDVLYSRKQVKTLDPIVNWNQTRKLLKNHFEKLKPEQIIQVVNNSISDDFILKGGYSLATMLSATVLNRMINSEPKTGQKHRIANDYVDDEDISKYFTEV